MTTLREFLIAQSTLPAGNLVRDDLDNPLIGGGDGDWDPSLISASFDLTEDLFVGTLLEDVIMGNLVEDSITGNLTEESIQADLIEIQFEYDMEETEDTLDVFIAEGYTVGVSKVYVWEYADEEERLAATGFSLSDVGYLAKQNDNDSLWMLNNEPPIGWHALSVGTDGMLKSVYDIDDDGVVDEAESIDGGTYT